ncbi:MAG TPA: NusG domain II-containing protein [archaeon]|nr:NusG domain II-containing protein [archaeon]
MRQQEFRLPPLYTFLDLLLLILIGASSVGFYWLRQSRDVAAGASSLEAVIKVGDKVVSRLELSHDTTLVVQGALGAVTVVVSGGALSFKNSPCPLKICEKTGPISRRGSVLVCAPGRVLARIQGGDLSRSEGLDAISR